MLSNKNLTSNEEIEQCRVLGEIICLDFLSIASLRTLFAETVMLENHLKLGTVVKDHVQIRSQKPIL